MSGNCDINSEGERAEKRAGLKGPPLRRRLQHQLQDQTANGLTSEEVSYMSIAPLAPIFMAIGAGSYQYRTLALPRPCDQYLPVNTRY